MNRQVVFISLLLLFFTIPHTLEDFAVGEPLEAGVPGAAISIVVATIIAIQALGLYWIGHNQRKGIMAQAGIGLFWPLAAGAAQLPSILGGGTYRAGFISVFFVVGIIVVGVLLLLTSLITLNRWHPDPKLNEIQ